MAITVTKPKWALALGLPVVVFTACFVLTLTPVFQAHRGPLSAAVLFDLLVSAPLLYLIAIRRTRVAKITVSRVWAAGLLVAGLILDAKGNAPLHFVKTWLAPVGEGWLIFYLARAFYNANKQTRQEAGAGLDFLTHTRRVLREVIGAERVADIIAAELAALYYALLARVARADNRHTVFSYHRESGAGMTLGLLLFLSLAETAVAHYLLRMWSPLAAWVVSGLSLYTCLQLFAHLRASRARPLLLAADALELKNGLAADARIAYTNIARVELTNGLPPAGQTVKCALLRGLEEHNVVIYLAEPVTVKRLFGIPRRAEAVAFFVDHPQEFLAALNTRVALSAASRYVAEK